VIDRRWAVLGQPWAHGVDSGTTILAGSDDPHIGTLVCDTYDGMNTGDLAEARALADHIVCIHNAWIDSQAPQGVATEDEYRGG
jgi:hypothetical protein